MKSIKSLKAIRFILPGIFSVLLLLGCEETWQAAPEEPVKAAENTDS